MADLFEAIAAGDTATVRDLLGADPTLAKARNSVGVTPALWACYVLKMDLAQEIADAARAHLDVFEAAALNRAERLSELLADDARLANARNVDGHTVLGLAAFFGADAAVRRLLDAGADPNAAAANDMRVAPLHAAAAAHRTDLIRLLLDAGADPNARQQAGWTPLHEAANNGDAEMAAALLSAGADPHAAAEDGAAPADKAAEAGHSGLAEHLRRQPSPDH